MIKINCDDCAYEEEIGPMDSDWFYCPECGGKMSVVPGQYSNIGDTETLTDKL